LTTIPFFEQLFKHQGVCLWGGDNDDYQFMQGMREELTTYESCYKVRSSIFIGPKPVQGGDLELAVYSDSYCKKERSSYSASSYVTSGSDYKLSGAFSKWNSMMEAYKVCQPCRAYSKYSNYQDEWERRLYEENDGQGAEENNGFNCYDDAGYRNCNQCFKFETHTDMEEASYDDLDLATKQGTIVSINIYGTTYGGSKSSSNAYHSSNNGGSSYNGGSYNNGNGNSNNNGNGGSYNNGNGNSNNNGNGNSNNNAYSSNNGGSNNNVYSSNNGNGSSNNNAYSSNNGGSSYNVYSSNNGGSNNNAYSSNNDGSNNNVYSSNNGGSNNNVYSSNNGGSSNNVYSSNNGGSSNNAYSSNNGGSNNNAYATAIFDGYSSTTTAGFILGGLALAVGFALLVKYRFNKRVINTGNDAPLDQPVL